MNIFKLLSLQNRFLVAPLIGVVLTLILYFASNAIIRSHSNLFQQLSQSNLPQVSKISHVTVLLINNHTELSTLLQSAAEDLNEEKTYLSGRRILDNLHELEGMLNQNINPTEKIIVKDIDVFEQIKIAFNDYRDAVISAIELSTVDSNLAHRELHNADKVLQQLNNTFLTLSEYHVKNLTDKSTLLQDSLYDHNILTIPTIILLLVMIFSALYFSKRMSRDLNQVNGALIKLSREEMDVQIPENSDVYFQPLIMALSKFKHTLDENKEQQHKLNGAIEELKDSNERYFNLLNITATAIIAIDHTQNIVLFNKAAERMFGYESQVIIGQPMEQLLPAQYRDRHQLQVKEFERSNLEYLAIIKNEPIIALRKNGEQFYIEANIAKLKLANEDLMTVSITDITERMHAEEKILQQAHFDSLTNLPNRFLSLDRLSQSLSEAEHKSGLVAVLFLDLDDFKKVNDSLGHETGDKLLIEAAKRLLASTRSGNTVGRLGGDEFILILPNILKASDASVVAENLLEQFRNTFNIEDREMILTASIGISVYPKDGDNASTLLRNADSAMYHAKNLGRNTYSYFTDSMNKEVSRRLLLEEQMHGALDRGEFRLLYQPLLDIDSEMIVGVEALLRWSNPKLGDVFPDEFIPIAEQTGLIIPIGKFVLTEALNMTYQWQQNFESKFRIAVNLSPRQFRDPNLVKFIEQALEKSNVSVASLELEITEGVLMSGHTFIDEALAALCKLGVGLAMDDFGTGYSSMSYLRKYPFNTLKIDRSFINDIMMDPADRELVNATIAMAHGLGLKVVAEGVETKEQLIHLVKQNCEYAQGYFFSKPVLPEKIIEMLEKQQSIKILSGSKA